MKIHASQHIPAYVETDQRFSADVHSLEELLAVPWIAQWAESYPDHDVTDRVTSWPDGIATERLETRHVKAKTFHRWSLADKGSPSQTLMAEYDGGDEFYVVAFLENDEPIPLPDWQETENARRRRERWNRGETGQ